MRRLWIDTDTASDDAVAILMALCWPDIRVEGISIVAGNVPVPLGSRNARYTVELCGADTPVYEGATRPLMREPVWAYFFHGTDGMGEMNYPEPKRNPASLHGVLAIIETLRQFPGEITLVTLGPLTNLALALRLAPDIVSLVAHCYIMGGAAATLGNITPAAEYNIWVDPEAAKIVFHSGLPITMVGWELCRGEANLNDEDMAEIRDLKNPKADFVLDCNRQALRANREWLHELGLPLPDPVAMTVALDPDVVTRASSHYVTVEVASDLTRGMTVVDERGVLNQSPNLRVVWAIDVPRWKRDLLAVLRKQ
ncbi:nucleoside hydrolase [uncultured Thermanaerothrix sp.]|uniref:nucleoside hydrolase n=1 Tax=uncultured Thermanaerothrix sp. TaxID=1195149 RepID=UPI002633413F|nr:nucleoside hydrolase [uncultured Thermanaerothrix sp.]